METDNKKDRQMYQLQKKSTEEITKALDEQKASLSKSLTPIKKLAEILIGEAKGEDGKTPTDEQITELIKPLIPEVKDGHTPTDEELLALMRPLIPVVKDGETPSDKKLLSLIRPLIPEVKDGETPSDDKITDLIKPLIPKVEVPVLDDIVKETLTRLRTLKEDERIPETAIKIDYERLLDNGKRHMIAYPRGNTDPVAPGASSFLDLTDTPNSYVGQAAKGVRVNAGATDLEFYTPSTSGQTLEIVSGAVDGSNTEFTFASPPAVLFVDEGRALRVGRGYTNAGNVATLDVAPTFDLFGLS